MVGLDARPARGCDEFRLTAVFFLWLVLYRVPCAGGVIFLAGRSALLSALGILHPSRVVR